VLKNGRVPRQTRSQAAEKVYPDFRLEVKNSGGTARCRERQRHHHLSAASRGSARSSFPIRLTTSPDLFRAIARSRPTPRPPRHARVARDAASTRTRRPGSPRLLPYIQRLMMRTTCVADPPEGGPRQQRAGPVPAGGRGGQLPCSRRRSRSDAPLLVKVLADAKDSVTANHEAESEPAGDAHSRGG